MDRGAWQATVHGVNKESDKTETHTLTFKGALCPYLSRYSGVIISEVPFHP